MSQQPESSPTSLATAALDGSGLGQAAPVPVVADMADTPDPLHRIPRWLQRLELFLRVMLRIYIGIAVCYAPWWPAFWDRNPIFSHFPALSAYAASGAIRGLVSGLGLLNLWIALRDALRFRESEARANRIEMRQDGAGVGRAVDGRGGPGLIEDRSIEDQ